MSSGTYSFLRNFQQQIFEKLFMTILFTLRVFVKNQLNGSEKIFFFHIFHLRYLTLALHRGLTTYYISKTLNLKLPVFTTFMASFKSVKTISVLVEEYQWAVRLAVFRIIFSPKVRIQANTPYLNMDFIISSRSHNDSLLQWNFRWLN